eukprot:5736744-Alexandrium_andersonii.AAC.1
MTYLVFSGLGGGSDPDSVVVFGISTNSAAEYVSRGLRGPELTEFHCVDHRRTWYCEFMEVDALLE